MIEKAKSIIGRECSTPHGKAMLRPSRMSGQWRSKSGRLCRIARLTEKSDVTRKALRLTQYRSFDDIYTVRPEVSKGFVRTSPSIPQGERVLSEHLTQP
jgi:hypothetical protein